MYAVVAIFDTKTEQIIKNIWQELKKQSISCYAFEVEDRRPHITLASYNKMYINEFIREMGSFCHHQSAISINFKTIGSFLNSGTLFLSPTLTKDLFDLHLSHHKHFEKYNNNPHSLYLPNHWIPHCTIANRLPLDKLKEAFSYCSERISDINGKLVEIVLIEVLDKKKEAPTVFSKKLKV